MQLCGALMFLGILAGNAEHGCDAWMPPVLMVG